MLGLTQTKNHDYYSCSVVEKAKQHYFQNNPSEALQDIQEHLKPWLTTSSTSSSTSSPFIPTCNGCVNIQSSPSQTTTTTNDAWIIYFCAKLSLGLPITKQEILKCNVPECFPLYFASPPLDPLTQLHRIMDLFPFFPTSLHTMAIDQFCSVLKQMEHREALPFVMQAHFLPPSIKDALLKEYQDEPQDTVTPSFKSSRSIYSSWFSLFTAKLYKYVDFLRMKIQRINFKFKYPFRFVISILLVFIWWKLRKHITKKIPLILMQWALTIV